MVVMSHHAFHVMLFWLLALTNTVAVWTVIYASRTPRIHLFPRMSSHVVVVMFRHAPPLHAMPRLRSGFLLWPAPFWGVCRTFELLGFFGFLCFLSPRFAMSCFVMPCHVLPCLPVASADSVL